VVPIRDEGQAARRAELLPELWEALREARAAEVAWRRVEWDPEHGPEVKTYFDPKVSNM
jgi:hypothetical protein